MRDSRGEADWVDKGWLLTKADADRSPAVFDQPSVRYVALNINAAAGPRDSAREQDHQIAISEAVIIVIRAGIGMFCFVCSRQC